MTIQFQNNLQLYFLVFLEGFVSIAIEILSLRQLTPFVGSNVVVTSIVIGIFLLFLAIGYYVGGLRQKNLNKALLINFLLTAGFAGFTLSYAFIEIFFHLGNQFFSNPLAVLILFCLISTAPMIFCLGQTIPITLNAHQLRIGLASGRTLFGNTLGSFLGAVLTSTLLFGYLGVACTVIIICCCLFILALMVAPTRYSQIMTSACALFLLWPIIDLNLGVEKNTFVQTNAYANYQVHKNIPVNENFGNILEINRSASSMITKEGIGFKYIEHIKQVLFHQLKLRNKKILVLGAGGFTLSNQNTFHNEITYVDIDGNLEKIVSHHFNPKIQGAFVAADGRNHLNNSPLTYDVIVLDVYSHVTSVPNHMLSQEFYKMVKKHLTPNGYMVANTILNPTFRDPYSKNIDNTIRSVFLGCSAQALNYIDASSNVVYTCANQAHPSTIVYTDNQNTADIDKVRSLTG